MVGVAECIRFLALPMCIFVFRTTLAFQVPTLRQFHGKMLGNVLANNGPIEVDVSDLGIFIDDLNTPLIDGADVETSGSSPLGYKWTESGWEVKVDLKHEGMRGQPAQAVSVDFTSTTVAVTIFGYAVWTGILIGESVPSGCSFQVIDDAGTRIPIISMVIRKSSPARWNDFISNVSPNSLLQ